MQSIDGVHYLIILTRSRHGNHPIDREGTEIAKNWEWVGIGIDDIGLGEEFCQWSGNFGWHWFSHHIKHDLNLFRVPENFPTLLNSFVGILG
jgi:hypothetical protein